ncbi:RHS repeat protein [Xenorhabdus sp. Sc-CR9]|uniref:RHS repeat protein n=1 Tax=Xenorhabdus sp. Sc-CR9 TaxID=2584468 RepID=UPI001F440D9E|nr:RHS repeat protein [Xenorhabdus sp. Sc-CR9]
MNNSFFSNAHNFQSAAMGSVDPRTGLFNYMILIAQLTGNNQLGPTQTITLSYNPLNEKNMGFGIGFSVGLTQYDRKNQLLALSTGERYKVTEFNNDVHLNQYKQDVVRFEKDVTQNAYRVIHKSGLIEVLTGPDNVDDLKVPVQIFTPLGHTLTLIWNFALAPVPYLVSISDEENVLLTVDYELDSYTRITIWPDTTESYEIQLLFDYGYVTEIKKQSDNHTLKWEMGYDKYIYTNNKLLSEVLSPTGLKESVNYNFNGHKFPAGVDLPPLPYVSKYTQYPGHGANIVRTYEYTNYNFLGYGGEGRWNKNSDYLYGVLSDYQYGSTETWNDGTNQRHITRRYNNYHLQVSEVTQQNKCKREHKTEYYAQVGVDFDKQAPQFQLPKSATVRFNDSSDEEVTQTQFDEAGNPMVQIAPDGTRTEWIYYSVDGEGEDCPADPHGFKRYVKSKTVIPCRSSPEDKYRDVPIHQEVYRYAQLPTLSGAPASYAVVCNYRGLYCNDQLLHDRQTHYVDAVNLRDHGRIQYIDETVHSMSNTATALLTRENWKSRQKFSYTLKDETLVQNIDWVGHDQLGLTTQSIQSRFSRKLWHEVDAQGCTAQYHYDDLGRLKKHISNMNTKYTQEIHYAYAIENKGSLTTTQTDVWGNQVRTRFDGLGRAYQQEVLEKGQESQGWRIVSETEYDSWGRVVNQTRNDWLPMEQNAGEVRQVSFHECFEYDDWGLLHRVTQDTGVSALQEYDPITRTAEITLQAEGVKFSKRTVMYNKRNQPLLHTLYDSQGKQYSQQANHYDGLGRLWTMVDTLGQETEYTYDLFGRVSTIRHSDGTVIQKSYFPFSKSNLVTQIQVGDHVLGTRSVDSLHRLTSTTSGGRTYHMAYPGDSLFPSQITDPLGTVITYQYESFLGNVPTQVDTDGIQQRFTYDPKTGAMVQASAVQQATHNMIYTNRH